MIGFTLWCFYTVYKTGRLPVYPATLFLGFSGAVAALMLDAGSVALSIIILPLAVDVMSRQPPEVFVKTAKATTLFLLFGVVLNVVAEPLLSNFVSNWRSSLLRGINSFTSEPSYLGITGLVLTSIFLFFKVPPGWTLMAVLLTVLSGSLTAIAPLLVLFLLRFAPGKMLLLLPVLVVVVWQLVFLLSETDSRLGYLLTTIVTVPSNIFMDVSFSNRILRGVGPLIASYQEGFIPHVFSKEINLYFTFLSPNTDENVERLSSLMTTLIYGLGFLSFPIFILYFMKSKAPVYLWVMCIYISVTNISIATPYIYVLLALPILQGKRMKVRTQ